MRYSSHKLALNDLFGASLSITPAGPRLSASNIAPRDFVRKNLRCVPFMQYAG